MGGIFGTCLVCLSVEMFPHPLKSGKKSGSLQFYESLIIQFALKNVSSIFTTPSIWIIFNIWGGGGGGVMK